MVEVLKRKTHVERKRMKVVLEIDIPSHQIANKERRAAFNRRVVEMADKFHNVGEEIVLLTTEEVE